MNFLKIIDKTHMSLNEPHYLNKLLNTTLFIKFTNERSILLKAAINNYIYTHKLVIYFMFLNCK